MGKNIEAERILKSIRTYLELNWSAVDFGMIASEARDLLAADYAILHLKDATGWMVTRGVAADAGRINIASRVLGESLTGKRWYMDQEQMEYLLEHPILSVPLKKQEHNCLVPGAVGRHLLNLFRIRSLYMVPVLYNNEVKGIIVLMSHQQGYTPDENMAEFFSYVLGTANARWDAEKHVQAIEEERNLVFAHMTGFVGRINVEGKWTYVSPSMQRITGLEGKYFTGSSCLERIHPDDQNIVRSLLSSQKEIAHRISFAVRIKHKDGHYVPLAVNARGIRSAVGDFLGTAVEGREICTANPRPDGSEDILDDGFVDSSGKIRGAWEWDLKEDRLFLARDSLNGLDLPGQDLIFLQDWLIAVHPADRKKMLGSLQALIKGEADCANDEYRLAAGGKWIRIFTQSIAFKDHSKGVIRSVVTQFSDSSFGNGQILRDFEKSETHSGTKASAKAEEKPQLVHDQEQGDLRYRCLAASSFEAIIVSEYVSGRWIYRDVNNAAEDIFGYTREELLSDKRDLIFSQVSEEEVLEKVNSGYSEIYYAEGKHKSGRLFPVAIRGKNYIEGDRIFRVGIIRDLTEERTRELELRKREEKIHSLIASLPDAVFRFDQSGTLVYTNPAAELLMGKSGAEIIQASAASPGHPGLVLDWEQMIQQVFADGQQLDYETSIETLQGKLDIHAYFIPEYEVKDKVVSVLCVAHDVTEQKTVEAKLKSINEAYLHLNADLTAMNEELIASNEDLTVIQRELEEQLKIIQKNEDSLKRRAEEWRALAENSPDIIARYDKNKIRVFINSAVEREMGVPVAQLIGKSIYDGGMREYVVSALASRIDEVFETREMLENFMEIETHKGFQYYHSRFVPEFGPNGEVEFVLNVTRNLTEQKRAEDLVRLNEERYRFFISSFHGIAFQGDLYYRPYFFGGNVAEITGYSEQEFMEESVSWKELVHPDDQALFLAHAKELEHQPGKRFSRQFRIIRKDGEVRWIHQFIQSLADGEGRATGVQGVMYDITEQVTSQEKLDEAHQLLITVLDSMDAHVYAADLDTDEVMYINQYGQNLWGDVVGRKSSEFLTGDQAYECSAGVSKEDLDEKGLPGGVVSREYYLEEDQRWFSARSRAVRWVDGRRARIEIATDLTERKQFEKELQASEERYRSLVENINDIVYELDREGIFKYISPVSNQVLGFEPAEIIGRSYEELIHAEDLVRVKESFIKTIGGITESAEFRIATKEGLWKHARSSSQQQWENGKVIGLVGVLSDMTEMKETEKALRDSEGRFRRLAENALDVVIRIDLVPEMMFTYVSPSVQKVTGYEPDRFYSNGAELLDLILEPNELERISDVLKDEATTMRPVELRLQHASGDQVWIEIVMNPIMDGQGTVAAYEGIARDITSRKKAESEIHHLTFHDILTGLYNRAYYEQELKRLDVPRQMPLSIIICDLNGLKLLNDSLGHHAGDQALIKTAEILRTSCRQEDVICRWGGDEFAILLPQTDSAAVAEVCNRIEQRCKEVNLELEIPVSLALGYSTKEDPSVMTESILKSAEDRMYRKKLLESKSTRSSIIASLLGSLENKTEETREHAERLCQNSLLIGKALGLAASELDKLTLLCTMHDIGKISIPEHILIKVGPLDENEWQIVRNHCEYGFRIAQTAPDLAHIALDILSHHEWWNGSGYPQGLEGANIPILSRILSVVDAYDVMIHGRPYKEERTVLEAASELVAKAAIQFDPTIVAVFVGQILGYENLVENIGRKNI